MRNAFAITLVVGTCIGGSVHASGEAALSTTMKATSQRDVRFSIDRRHQRLVVDAHDYRSGTVSRIGEVPFRGGVRESVVNRISGALSLHNVSVSEIGRFGGSILLELRSLDAGAFVKKVVRVDAHNGQVHELTNLLGFNDLKVGRDLQSNKLIVANDRLFAINVRSGRGGLFGNAGSHVSVKVLDPQFRVIDAVHAVDATNPATRLALKSARESVEPRELATWYARPFTSGVTALGVARDSDGAMVATFDERTRKLAFVGKEQSLGFDANKPDVMQPAPDGRLLLRASWR